jgi:phenylacetate-CoA ligase
MKKSFSFFVKRLLKNNPYFLYRFNKIETQKALPHNIVEEKRNLLFKNLVHRAYKHSVFYKNLFDQFGLDIQSIKDLSDLKSLPVVTKDMVKKNVDDILTVSPLLCKKAYTSGTSGSPLTVYRDYYSIVEEEAYIWSHRKSFGHVKGDKVVSLRVELDRNTFKVHDSFSNILHLSSFNLSNKTVERYYQEIIRFSPVAIYAFPSSAEILANFLLDKGLELYVPLIFTSSETLYDFQRAKIEKVFNSRIVDWYGNAERSIALEENKEGYYDELPFYSYNEYEENRTITTGLINSAFPLIRYEVQDVIIPSVEDGKIDQIIGRVDDKIILPDGSKVVRLGTPFKELDDVKFAQIIQKSFDTLDINIVPSNYFLGDSKQKIIKKLQAYIGHDIKLKVNIISEDQLIKSDRGKYKLVINQLENNGAIVPSQ